MDSGETVPERLPQDHQLISAYRYNHMRYRCSHRQRYNLTYALQCEKHCLNCLLTSAFVLESGNCASSFLNATVFSSGIGTRFAGIFSSSCSRSFFYTYNMPVHRYRFPCTSDIPAYLKNDIQ